MMDSQPVCDDLCTVRVLKKWSLFQTKEMCTRDTPHPVLAVPSKQYEDISV